MELNQELIKKALECCGEEIICGVENGENTYYVSFAEVLTLINELAEENERLKLENVGFEAGARYAAEFIKANTAREIFAEIETVLCSKVTPLIRDGKIVSVHLDELYIRYEDYNTIKKRYTEEQK